MTTNRITTRVSGVSGIHSSQTPPKYLQKTKIKTKNKKFSEFDKYQIDGGSGLQLAISPK
jgi:hypothetical protein